MTLSCEHLRRNGMTKMISKLNTLNLTDDDFKNISYQENCNTLNKYPVVAVRHFQDRAEAFLSVCVEWSIK